MQLTILIVLVQYWNILMNNMRDFCVMRVDSIVAILLTIVFIAVSISYHHLVMGKYLFIYSNVEQTNHYYPSITD